MRVISPLLFPRPQRNCGVIMFRQICSGRCCTVGYSDYLCCSAQPFVFIRVKSFPFLSVYLLICVLIHLKELPPVVQVSPQWIGTLTSPVDFSLWRSSSVQTGAAEERLSEDVFTPSPGFLTLLPLVCSPPSTFFWYSRFLWQGRRKVHFKICVSSYFIDLSLKF